VAQDVGISTAIARPDADVFRDNKEG